MFQNSMEGWGISKARQQYAQNLEDTCNRLTKYPDLGKSRDKIFPGAFSFPVGSHVIFYRKSGDHIEIARVLHKRMDFEHYFDSES